MAADPIQPLPQALDVAGDGPHSLSVRYGALRGGADAGRSSASSGPQVRKS
jgi:hypothetical protein